MPTSRASDVIAFILTVYFDLETRNKHKQSFKFRFPVEMGRPTKAKANQKLKPTSKEEIGNNSQDSHIVDESKNSESKTRKRARSRPAMVAIESPRGTQSEQSKPIEKSNLNRNASPLPKTRRVYTKNATTIVRTIKNDNNKGKSALVDGKVDCVQEVHEQELPSDGLVTANVAEQFDMLPDDQVLVSVTADDDDFQYEGEEEGEIDEHAESSDEGELEQDEQEETVVTPVAVDDSEAAAFAEDARSVGTVDSEVSFGNKQSLRDNPEVMQLVKELVREEMGRKPPIKKPGKKITVVKSPSDTTVYAPALKRTPERINLSAFLDKPRGHNVSNNVTPVRGAGTINMERPTDSANDGSFDNQIANFVERIRLETIQSMQKEAVKGQDEVQPSTSADSDNAAKLQQAKAIAEESILQAEKFKAAITPLPGMESVNQGNVDDEFFHITCHVEQSLKEKIEKGEFIDLERLIAKPYQTIDAAQKLELVHKDGQTFFAAATGKENRIGSVRKWDQAFRIYAAIYSRANPHRAAEIWQYVHVIHTAAASYVWENVSQYDLVFRQLMGAYPSRSWANIYHQMWNLSMKEPIHRGGNQWNNHGYGSNNSNNSFGSGGNRGSGSGSAQSAKARRSKYCWKFNKNRTYDADCRFEHKCKFCDATEHAFHNCPKRNQKAT